MVDPAALQRLLDSFADSGFLSLPQRISGACSDDVFTKLELRHEAGWTSIRYGRCSRAPAKLLELTQQVKSLVSPNPCGF